MVTYKNSKNVLTYGFNTFLIDEDFAYTVDPPSYLRLTGNFAITNNKDLSLIIWPALFMKGKAEHVVGIEDESTELIYRFYVDEELNYVRAYQMNYTQDEEKYVKKY